MAYNSKKLEPMWRDWYLHLSCKYIIRCCWYRLGKNFLHGLHISPPTSPTRVRVLACQYSNWSLLKYQTACMSYTVKKVNPKQSQHKVNMSKMCLACQVWGWCRRGNCPIKSLPKVSSCLTTPSPRSWDNPKPLYPVFWKKNASYLHFWAPFLPMWMLSTWM